MADAFIDFPMVYIQVHPYILKENLHTVEPDRVKTVKDVYATLIGGGQHKPSHAVSVARVLAVHYGFLPDGFAKEVKGIDTADLSKYGQMQRSIMTELYGKSSFLYEYVRGEVSADACAVAITNWDLCARQCDLAVAGETEQERLARVARGNRYRQAISQLQSCVKEAYVDAIDEVYRTLAEKQSKAIEKFVARQLIPFFEQKRDEVIQPLHSASTSVSDVRELEMLKIQPLFCRNGAERHQFWKTRVNGDLIATMFRLAKGTVDLRTLFDRADWVRVWGRKLVATMDCMHRTVINLEMCLESFRSYSNDLQMLASVDIDLNRAGTNRAIRNIVKLVKEPAETWNWQNIPIIQATRKRSAQD